MTHERSMIQRPGPVQGGRTVSGGKAARHKSRCRLGLLQKTLSPWPGRGVMESKERRIGK